ncbi:unnamed protein product [Ceratitis capitata]|uniref:(Mediterranean fruit fly) hypothetical protein n=1 Tax=Ceratitis capitata TaxID=7213 RepID=A0A811VF00_CERCA|nr:unnamed protein product [Ceratitis capitata]
MYVCRYMYKRFYESFIRLHSSPPLALLLLCFLLLYFAATSSASLQVFQAQRCGITLGLDVACLNAFLQPSFCCVLPLQRAVACCRLLILAGTSVTSVATTMSCTVGKG